MPPGPETRKGGKGKGADDEEEAEHATASIADISSAIVHLANLATRAEDDRNAVHEALTACKESVEGFQTYLEATKDDKSSSSTIKTDPIVGEITPGTKPVLEPMPDVKPLPDGFRYKPDLANPTGQALHFEQCIDRIRDHSEKQVRGIIKTLRKEYVQIQYQYRPGWQPANIAQKFTGPTAEAKPVTTAEVIHTLKEVQDQFRDELLHFGFNSERCKKVQWYLDHAMQLQTGVENGMLTAQEAMNDISTIKAWSRDDAYRQ